MHIYRSESLILDTSTSGDTSIHIGADSSSGGLTNGLFVRGRHMYVNAGEDFNLVTESLSSLPVVTRLNIGKFLSQLIRRSIP